MRKVQTRNLQSAQGMVEFALVLPILLLVIFGIFAFGHFFFAYSSVVSASRDAARWGSAVGVTDSLIPRYQDCAAIRATAVRTGAFAGVSPVDGPDNSSTAGIYIGFDHGPTDPDEDFDDCSDEHGPTNLAYGDRINVRVTVMYHTIVPLVNIPDIPISATTSRTVVQNLPVGEPPVAQSFCRRTTIDMAFIPDTPVVGEPVDFHLVVFGSDGVYPPGEVTINDDAGHSCTFTVPGETSCATPLVPEGYPNPGIHLFDVTYTYVPSVPPGPNCYRDQEIDGEPLEIYRADTSVTIIDHDNGSGGYPTNPGEEVFVTAQVTVDWPGAGSPTGTVTVTADDGVTVWTSNCILDAFGLAICRDLWPVDNAILVATYNGDTRFNPSVSPPVLHLVNYVTPPQPPYCPHIVAGSFAWVANGGQMAIVNDTGVETIHIQQVRISWPDTPDPAFDDFAFNEIRFGSAVGIDACRSNGNPANQNCLFQAPENGELTTPPAIINSSVSNWQSTYDSLDVGSTKVFRAVFNSAVVPVGPYAIRIRFQNNCEIYVAGDVN